jgi:malonate transporter
MLGLFQSTVAVMISTLEILLPIFALILAGFVCRRRGIFGPTAATELNRLVVWLALPALLFDVMAHVTWQQMDQPAFAAAFGLGCGIVFVSVLVVARLRGRHLADASIDAIAAAYPNTGFIGFPLCMMLYGSSSLVPATIATIIVVCILFAITIVLIEVGLEKERRPHIIGMKVLVKLLRNPLVVTPIAGFLVAVGNVPVPASVESFLKLTGMAASPCALICLGVFLGEKRATASAPLGAWALALVKLFVQPALTWWLAACVFHLSRQLVHMAVLLSALPTGTGPFMLAEFYKREPMAASRTILFSTILSLLTLSILLFYIQ